MWSFFYAQIKWFVFVCVCVSFTRNNPEFKCVKTAQPNEGEMWFRKRIKIENRIIYDYGCENTVGIQHTLNRATVAPLQHSISCSYLIQNNSKKCWRSAEIHTTSVQYSKYQITEMKHSLRLPISSIRYSFGCLCIGWNEITNKLHLVRINSRKYRSLNGKIAINH